MRHGVVGNRLNRDSAHRKAMLKNLATSVLAKGLGEDQMSRQIVTTVPKAKAVRSLVERLITYAKKGDLAARREAARFIPEKLVLKGLFEVLGKRYKDRNGGYTRVLKLSSNRHGDNAEMAMISLVEDTIKVKPKKKAPKAKVKAEKKIDITKTEKTTAPKAKAKKEAKADEAAAE